MVRRYFPRSLRYFSVVVLCLACTDQGPGLPSCSTTVAVSVSPGTQPTFNWSPACEIATLTVALTSNDAAVWGTLSLNQRNAIVPPVTYGIAPPGAAQTAERLETYLTAGTTYRVTLHRFDGRQGGALRTVGVANFVP